MSENKDCYRSLKLSGSLMVLASCIALSSGAAPEPTTAPANRGIDFNRDIRPILAENCLACHGPDKNKRKAGLRLDRRE